MNYLQQFRVLPGAKVKLKDIDPAYKDQHQSHEQAAEEIATIKRDCVSFKSCSMWSGGVRS